MNKCSSGLDRLLFVVVAVKERVELENVEAEISSENGLLFCIRLLNNFLITVCCNLKLFPGINLQQNLYFLCKIRSK